MVLFPAGIFIDFIISCYKILTSQEILIHKRSPLEGIDSVEIALAEHSDLAEILDLQVLAYQSEAKLYNDWSLPALTQTLESLQDEFANSTFLKASESSRVVGSVRAQTKNGTCLIGRLIVHPDFQRRGIGSKLLESIEARCSNVTRYELFTGSKSLGNIRLYEKHGYNISHKRALSETVELVFLEKQCAK